MLHFYASLKSQNMFYHRNGVLSVGFSPLGRWKDTSLTEINLVLKKMSRKGFPLTPSFISFMSLGQKLVLLYTVLKTGIEYN